MTPFNNELQVGQPAMIIDVEYDKNRHLIGTTIIVDCLYSPEESKDLVFEANGHAYASYIRESDVQQRFIRQKYLMPLPPLGDVYDEEVFEELSTMRVKCP